MSKPTTIIAEIGVNHNGSLEKACRMVDEAKACGADIVKFQSWVAEELASSTAPKAEYQERNDQSSKSQLEMLKAIELSRADHFHLKEYCETRSIEFLSSSFGGMDSTFLSKELKCKKIKIGSGELTNLPLLYHTAQLGVEIILSTGMATIEEVDLALGSIISGYHLTDDAPSLSLFKKAILKKKGLLEGKVTLLQCTSEYPCPDEYIHLRVMDTYRERYGLPVGFSDHSDGTHIPIAAVARGAVMIEKHFTLDRSDQGPDHKASLEPKDFKRMCQYIRSVEKALGNEEKAITPPEEHTKKIVQKTIVAAQSIQKGEKFSEENLTTIRVGQIGYKPAELWSLIGKEATKDYVPYALIERDDKPTK